MIRVHIFHLEALLCGSFSSDDREIIMRIVTRLLTPLMFLLAMLLPVGGATAAPAESSRSEYVTFSLSGCNGEFVKLEGTIHIVSKQQKDGFIQHVNIHGGGVGDQGNEYVLNHIYKSQSTTSDSHGSFDDRILVVGKGSAPNFVTIIHSDSDTGFTFETDCRG